MSTPGIPFGDPRHTFKQTTEVARKAAVKGKRASPWARSAMCSGARATKVFEANKREK
jgi:hypothetical protein